MNRQAKFEGQREVRTFAQLAHGADVLLGKAEADESGSAYTLMGSLLLRAFTFEAYLNHLGETILGLWGPCDRMPVLDKYRTICDAYNVKPDWSRQPHQTMTELFKFRNQMAHGRSFTIQESRVVPADSDPHELIPEAPWEKYCTLETAKRAKDDMSEIITELHKAAGQGDYPFIHGVGIGSLSLKE